MTDNELKDKLISLTRDLILVPSIPSRPDDLRRCFEFVKNHLESLEHIELKEFEHKGKPSLVVVPPGCDCPDIMMCGHLDVITHMDMGVYTSQIKDERIYGPGAGDMKGALAILMEVFRSMHSQYPKASLGLTITSDEETGGESGIGFLFNQAGINCKAAMIPDGGSLNKITVEEKGILHVRVKAKGETAHAARPWLGNNPIEHLMNQLTALKQYFGGLQREEDRWYPTAAITIIETENQTVNRIPVDATATLDIRFPPPFTAEKICDDIRGILGKDISLEIIIQADPTILSPDPLYKQMTEEVTTQAVDLVKDDGGSDARFLASKGIPVMMSRPLVGNLHAEDEWIDIPSMVQFYQIYEKFLHSKLLK